jgi:predicted nucleic acid-binding protein
LIALDTSVVVPAISGWHVAHEASRKAAHGGTIPAHALAETYAVVTRLPAPHLLPIDVAARLLKAWFPNARVLVPSAALTRSFTDRLAAAHVAGGAVYDGIVGLTAAAHGAELLTRDQRAARTYERLGVAFRLLSG